MFGGDYSSDSTYSNNSFNNCLGTQVHSCNNYNSHFINPGISADPKLKYLPDASQTIDSTKSPRSQDGLLIGAQILKRYELGKLSNIDLWPFPNEKWIKRDFADIELSRGETNPQRGFCSPGTQLNGIDEITLTSYIFEYLGYPIQVTEKWDPNLKIVPMGN